jgi:hypothetical protein
VPDTRSHRGPHPRDKAAFTAETIPILQRAVAELSWLRSRGYAAGSALQLVGDRHQLITRQRMALQRCAAADDAVRRRRQRQLDIAALRDETVDVDGYNVLLTVEAALSGGLVLLARDGVYRDLTALSNHYKRVDTTRPALTSIGRLLFDAGARGVRWLLDRPISNSARLARLIDELAAELAFPWSVELVASPDRILRDSADIVATADSAILDRCGRWFNLARATVDSNVSEPWIVDLSGCSTDQNGLR